MQKNNRQNEEQSESVKAPMLEQDVGKDELFVDIKKTKDEMRKKREQLQKDLMEAEKATRQHVKHKVVMKDKARKQKSESFDLGDILDEAMDKFGASFKPSETVVEPEDRPRGKAAVLKKKTMPLQKKTPPALQKPREDVALLSKVSAPPKDTGVPVLLALPQSKPSDTLRLHVPSTGIMPIDSSLTINFGAPVADLKTYVSQMQQRLKASFPRMDTLPYDIWTSDNPRTLQTWLRILVSRWQTRFDNTDHTNQLTDNGKDGQVKAVLDQMVRDHDLSNDAAERMAMRWHEVFDKRTTAVVEDDDSMHWDEYQAGGMGFLMDEHDAELDSAERNENQSHHSGTLSEGIPDDMPTYSSITRRLYSTSSRHSTIPRRFYSTSSRPPLDPQSSPAIPTSDSELESTTLPASMTKSSTSPAATQPALPHLTASGSAHMVSVSAKAHTVRTAIAVGTIYFSNATPLSLIRSNSLKKGDVLGVSRIAGIMAAKKCPDLIPLCHPIALTHVGVELKAFPSPSITEDDSAQQSEAGARKKNRNDMGYGGVTVEAKVQCTGPTGVEMEALTAVMGAALSVVDMCKAVDKFQRVQDIRVVLKEGGKSGVWKEVGWVSDME